MGLINKILRRKALDPDARRRFLLENGRITDGTIIDTKIDSDGRELFVYTLNGVDLLCRSPEGPIAPSFRAGSSPTR